jgi:hypothetical protein
LVPIISCFDLLHTKVIRSDKRKQTDMVVLIHSFVRSFIHSFCNMPDDRSIASSKASSP